MADELDPRSDAERADDHAAIERLAADLVPALSAKLAASGLGEIEVREGSWKVRLRRPAGQTTSRGAGPEPARRSTDRPSRAQPGHAGHGHAPAGLEGHRSARDRAFGTAGHSTNGSTPPTVGAAGTGPDGAGPGVADGPRDERRAVATSPAVGIYQPRAETRPGSRVRAGDRLGAVDMLGIAQEVVAPADGIVGESLVEPGQAVEYGQDLVVIELAIGAHGEG